MKTKPIYRMSQAGMCPRALSAMRLGYEPAKAPAYLERAAEEGRWHEQRIIDELRADDIAVAREQDEVVLDYPEFRLVGHIDGVVYDHSDEPKLLEIKSMSQYEFDRWMRHGFEGFPEYGAQLTCYMGATGLSEARYIVKNRSSGYEDTHAITETPFELADVIDWLEQVEAHVARGELYPVQFDPQRIQCQRCLYQHLCITKPEPTEVDIAMLDKAVEQWRKGKAMADEAKALMDEADLTLGSYANKLDTKRFVHNQLAVQLLHTRRESYPKEKLLKVFTSEQLAPALEVKEYDQLRHNDMAKGE